MMQRWMNTGLVLLLAALLLGGGLRPQTAVMPEPGYEVGRQALPLEGADLNGEVIRLSDLRGKAVFVNFWATWCGPCILEMPAIQRLQEQLPPGTAILAVNATQTEPDVATVREFISSREYTFPVLLDPSGQAMFANAVVGFPTSLFISPDGVITDRHTGPMNYATMRSKLEAALAGAAASGAAAAWRSPVPDVWLVGNFPLNTSILTMAAGLLVMYGWAAYRIRRAGAPAGAVGDLLSALALGGFLGAKLAAVLAAPGEALAQPLLLLVQHGGPGEWVSGVLGAAAWAAWEVRRLPQRQAFLTAVSPPLLAGMAVALLPRGWWHLGLLAAAALAAALALRPEVWPGETGTAGAGEAPAAGTATPGGAWLLAVLLGAGALVAAEFTVPGPVVAGGLTVPQLALGAAGLAAYALLAWTRRAPAPAPPSHRDES